MTISLFVLSSCGSANEDALALWKHEHDSAFSAFRNNDFEKATSKYLKAIEAAREIRPADSRVERTLNELALVLRAKGDFVGARNVYLDAAQNVPDRLRKSPGDHGLLEAYGESLRGLANVEEHLGNGKLAAEYYEKSLDVAQTGRLVALLRDLQSEYVSFLEKNGEVVKAGDTRNKFIAAMTAAAPVAGDARLTDERYDDFIVKGGQFERKGDRVSAEHEYQQAWALAVSSEQPRLQGNAAKALGLMMLVSKQYSSAEEWLRKSLQCYERDPKTGSDRHDAYIGLTQALASQNKNDEAVRTADGAVENARLLASSGSRQLSEALSAAGAAAVKSGKYGVAADHLTEIYELSRKKKSIESPDCTMNLCYAANLHWLAGHHADAQRMVKSYEMSLLTLPARELALPGRLLTEYAAVVSKTGQPKEAILFYSSAKVLLEKAADRGPVYRQACAGFDSATNILKSH